MSFTGNEEKVTFNILDRNMEELENRIAKINKRARKIGAEELTLLNFGQEDIEDGHGIRRVYQVMLVGDPPIINGWKFIATLNHIKEVGTIVRPLPGIEVDEKYRTGDPVCEHCLKNRRRRDTYLLQHESGAIKQVGKMCLADFTGSNSPGKICSYAELYTLATEAMRQVSQMTFPQGELGYSFINLRTYLEYVAEEIIRWGWTGRQQARKLLEEGRKDVVATADRAYSMMWSMSMDKVEPSAAAVEVAAKTLEWVDETISPKGEMTDYEHNLSVIFSSGALEPRSIGIAASAVWVYRRAMEKEANEQTQQTAIVSRHLGQVGQKITANVKLLDKKPIEGMMGTTWLHRFVDDQGNLITWFSTTGSNMETGQSYTIAGKVKKHDVFRGTNTTLVSHVKPV